MFRSIVKHYQNKVASLEKDIVRLKNEIKELEFRDNLNTETIDWYHKQLQEARISQASTARINVDLMSGAIQFKNESTGEWQKAEEFRK